MPNLGSLWYTMGIRDLTDADLQKINTKLKNLGFDIVLTPKILKDLTQAAVPKGVKIELDPMIKNDAVARAVEGKVMRVAVTPLLTGFREAIVKATRDNPPQAEIGVSAERLRKLIENVLTRQGFMLNISTVNDNYSKAIQTKLNGTRYNIKIHADANEIARSVQASLTQVQSRYFGLKVSRDILYRSIDEALGQRQFKINIAVQQGQARQAVQDALLRAQVIGKEQALAYQRLQTGELKAAQAELARLKAAHMGAAEAAKAHASASVNLGGVMGSNIKIAGELGAAMASMYSINAAKEFLSQVIEIGGELEHQKIAMNTIFGDRGKTNELFGQIKGLARTSPFGVMELSKSVKALSAYGVEYNEIYDTAKRLADISAATSVDINRLILAFGKTRSRGFLDGLEAKQFAYANIPIYEMVRKKLEELEGQAVTTADVMARMKKREISFDIVKDVLWDITDPGGKFYNMQEALAGSVKTSWKLVRDNIELMFGEIAESSVGEGLKSTAEILQVLTRNWRTLGAVIGAGAVALGVYKVAVAASNTLMGEANALALQKVAASNKAVAANAMEAASYRALTIEENNARHAKSGLEKLNRSLLLSHRALTKAEWAAVLASEAVNKDYILRRIALGRLTQAEIDYLLAMEAVNAEEVRTAVAARNLKFSMASLFATIETRSKTAWASFLSFCARFKAGVVGMATSARTMNATSLWAWIRTLPTRMAHAEFSVTRLKLAFAGLGRVAKSIGAFLLNPITLMMAAIGGAMYAWQKNNEQMEKAKEIGDNIFTKATEGANNLKQVLRDIKPSAGLSEHELTQGIEQLEQAIKDYSPRPLQDINDSLVAQDGRVLTLAERYDTLRTKVEEVAKAYELMGNVKNGDVGMMVSDAIKSTGGILNDTVVVNAKDYTDALKERSETIRKATIEDARWIKKAVDEAIKADGAFAEAATRFKNTAAMFNELASNPEKYSAEYELPAVRATIGAAGILDINRSIEEEKEKFDSDVQTLIKSITANIRITWDKEIKDLDATQKDALAISLKNMLDQADGVSEEVKMRWAKTLEDAFGITIIENKIGPALASAITSALNGAIDAGTVAMVDKWKHEGLNSLTEAEAKRMKDIITESTEKVKSELAASNEEMQQYLKDHPLSQTIQLVWEQSKPSDFQQEVWNEKIAKRLSERDTTPSVNAGLLTDRAKQAREWFNSWTRGSAGYKEAQDRYNADRKAIVDEIKAAKNASKEWLKSRQDMLDLMDATAADMNLLKSREKGDDNKDAFAESLKQRFKDIKDAWSEFQKWSKTEGREAAAKRIRESGLFSSLSADKIPQTVEEYRALVVELENELRQAGVKGTAREGLLNDLLKQLLDIDKTVVDEQLKLALDKVSKEAERQLADWNLFDKIRKATGNQDLAMSIAFGMNATAETDYPTMIKNQFAEVAKQYKKFENLTFDMIPDESYLTEAPKEIQEAYKKATDALTKYAREQKDAIADILSEYQSLQDKLTKIDADRERKIMTVNKSDMSAPDKAKYIQRINVEAGYQKFTQSNEYLQFFAGIYALTNAEATKIGDLIEQNLNKRLQAGTISAEDYYKEIERVRQQLDKLRNVKSTAMTFLTKGTSGVNEKKQEANDAARLETIQKIAELEETIAAQKAAIKGIDDTDGHNAVIQTEQQLAAAKEELAVQDKIREKLIKNEKQWKNILDVANIAANIAGGMSDAFNTLRDMADSFGFDTESNAWETAAAVMDTLTTVTGGVQKVIQSAMSGDIGGIISGAFDTLLTPFTIWNKLHDKKLQKDIELSKRRFNQYDRLVTAIERKLNDHLGGYVDFDPMPGTDYGKDGAFGYERDLKKAQLEELKRQQADMEAMKKKDPEAIEDIKAQISELTDEIANLEIEAANTLYGIEIKGYAETIGDALWDAFMKGEDAAEAFDKAVADIMSNVVKNILKVNVLERAFQKTKDWLASEDGPMSDGILDESEARELWQRLMTDGKKGMENWNAAMDAMPEDMKQFLQDNYDTAKSGLSAGIQSVTEDTADLLASYINQIRADVAMQTGTYWTRLLDDALPQMNVIAQSQLDTQRQIAENTLRNAVAAEAIMKSNDDISRLLNRVTQGGAKFYVN